MKKITAVLGLTVSIIFIAITILISKNQPEIKETHSNEKLYYSFEYEVNPDTFEIKVTNDEKTYNVSMPQKELQPENVEYFDNKMSWNYPEKQISINVRKEKDYLSVTATSMIEAENTLNFPVVSGEEYYIPLGEGKRIPVTDSVWNDYLTSMDFSMVEQLSMPFFSSVIGDKSLVYILDNPNRSQLHFSDENTLSFGVMNHYSSLQKNKSLTYRIYLTDNSPVKVAKIYKKYVEEKGDFKTLKEKAEENENVMKLYGAPHIYLWNQRIVTPDNIQWNAFLNFIQSDIMAYVVEQTEELKMDQEFKTVLDELKSQNYVNDYQKNVICNVLSSLMKKEDFYNKSVLKETNEMIKSLFKKGIENLNPMEIIELNKNLLYENIAGVFTPVSTWADSATTDIMNEMKSAGIENAWIGLDNWETAYAKPSILSEAKTDNYLIATYDSYHSIHEPGREEWNTAAFCESDLYDNGTISDINGKKIEGFNKVGRKLNPTLSLEEVKKRVETLIDNGLDFNSWFIDCDATGEIYDDYSSEHLTSKEEDLKARLKRMSYIQNEKNMVIGSEGGNDFASNLIAFAHGIELPSFSWYDSDMKEKDSEYYIGKYYSQNGGVPDHFGKQIKVKEYLKQIFLDSRYDIPLYKLVYNDSVITTYHWDWSTLKIEDEIQNRMLREILYNVAPLYHLDKTVWEQWKTVITEHTKQWAEFSKRAVLNEMTNFEYLDEQRYVQKTEFGKSIYAISNFGKKEYVSQGTTIPAKSVLISIEGEAAIYTPKIES